MRQKTISAVYSYYEQLRAGRAAPLRSEINPAELKAALPDVFMLEQLKDASFSFRLAGTRTCLVFGREARNTDFAAIWEPNSARRMVLAAQSVLATGQILRVDLVARGVDEPEFGLEMLLMPLSSKPGVVDRIFGCLAADDSTRPLTALHRWLLPTRLQFLTDEHMPRSILPSVEQTAPVQQATRPLFRVIDGGRRD